MYSRYPRMRVLRFFHNQKGDKHDEDENSKII